MSGSFVRTGAVDNETRDSEANVRSITRSTSKAIARPSSSCTSPSAWNAVRSTSASRSMRSYSMAGPPRGPFDAGPAVPGSTARWSMRNSRISRPSMRSMINLSRSSSGVRPLPSSSFVRAVSRAGSARTAVAIRRDSIVSVSVTCRADSATRSEERLTDDWLTIMAAQENELAAAFNGSTCRFLNAARAIQPGILQGQRVFARLEMRDHRRAWYCRTDVALDLLHEIVPALHRPGSRHQDVHRDEGSPRRLTGHQRMEIDAACLIARQHCTDRVAAMRPATLDPAAPTPIAGSAGIPSRECSAPPRWR